MHRAAVVRMGDRATLSLGKDILDRLQWDEGEEAQVQIDEANRRITITVPLPAAFWAEASRKR